MWDMSCVLNLKVVLKNNNVLNVKVPLGSK